MRADYLLLKVMKLDLVWCSLNCGGLH